MALNSTNKEQFSFKKLVGKAHTQQTFAATEESIASNVQIAFSTIFSDVINPLPETDGGLINTGDTDNIVEKLRFEIDIIPDTLIGTNQSQGYRLKLPAGYSGVLSSQFSGGTYLNETLGKLQIVPSLYGTLKGDGSTEYDVSLLETDGSTVIQKFDSINWNLDSYNGTLFVQDPPSGYDVSANRPGFIDAFLFVGDYLDTSLSGVSGNVSGERIEKLITQSGHSFVIGDVLSYSGGTYIKSLAVSTQPESLGIVNSVIDVNKFTITYSGYIDSLSSVTDDNGLQLSGNTLYYVSDTNLGKLSSVEPISINDVVKPIIYVLDAATDGIVLQYKSDIITSGSSGGSSGVTVINLGGGEELGITPNPSNQVQLRTIIGSGNTIVSTVNDNVIIFSSGGSGSGTVTGGTNGIVLLGNNVGLGGSLTGETIINTGGFGIGIGNNVIASGTTSFAIGNGTIASGFASSAQGFSSCATGTMSHAQGAFTVASGNGSFASGYGITTREILSSGISSFNHSFNNGLQTIGHGALANYSAIIGGINHNISTGNTGATIIGGNSIKLTGTSYTDTTVVSNLSINDTPLIGISSDFLLVRDSTTGIIKTIDQSGLTATSISDIYTVTSISANTTLDNNEFVVIVDSTLSGLTVSLPSSPVNNQPYKIKDSGNALINNITIFGNGKNIDGNTSVLINTDYGAFEMVYSLIEDEWYILSFVN